MNRPKRAYTDPKILKIAKLRLVLAAIFWIECLITCLLFAWVLKRIFKMRSYQEIARRIAKIILSPESALGFIDGILSVPTDIGYLAYGFIDTDSRYQRETERIRMMSAIRHGIFVKS